MIVNDQASSRRISAVLAVVLAVLQLALVPNVGILGGRANLALVLAACACLGGEVRSAPVIGCLSGLFYDMTGTGPIGLMALLLTLLAWAYAATGRTRVADDVPAALAIFAPSAVGVGVVYALILLATGQASSFVDVVFLRAVPGAALDCLAFWIVGTLLSRMPGASSSGLSLGGGKKRSGHYDMKGL